MGNPNHDKIGRFSAGTYGAAGTTAKAGGSSNVATGHNAGGGNRLVADHIKQQHVLEKVNTMHWGEHIANPSIASHVENQAYQTMGGPRSKNLNRPRTKGLKSYNKVEHNRPPISGVGQLRSAHRAVKGDF